MYWTTPKQNVLAAVQTAQS